MRRVVTLCTTLLIVGCAEERDPPPTVAERNAREVIDSLVVAAGGAERLDGIETFVIRYEFIESRKDPQSGEFREMGRINVLQARDFVLGRSLYELQAHEPEERWERVVMLPGGAFRVDLLTGRGAVFTQGAENAAQYAGLLLRWYVYFPILQARMAGPALRFVGDTVMNGVQHDIVAFSDRERGEVRLYIDRDSSRLRLQRWQTSELTPTHGAIAYDQYRDVDGVPFPFSVTVLTGDDQEGRYEMSDVQLNATLMESAFALPSGS